MYLVSVQCVTFEERESERVTHLHTCRCCYMAVQNAFSSLLAKENNIKNKIHCCRREAGVEHKAYEEEKGV